MIRPSQMLSLVVAGCALAGVGLWLSARNGADRPSGPEGHVLPLKQENLNAVTGLRIYKGDGSHTTLTRDAARWVVAERGYPADSGQVRKFLLDLGDLNIEEQKTQNSALYPKLGVEDPNTVQAGSTGVDIDVNGRKLGLIVGRTSGTNAVYVRVADNTQSLLATPQLTPDSDPRRWLDRSILDIAPDQINEVDIELQDGPRYAVKRAAMGSTGEYELNPLPKGRELADPAAPAAQAGLLTGLQLDDVRKAGTAAPIGHATFHTRDDLVLTLSGTKEGERRFITVVASTQAAGAQARVSDLNARLSGWEFELPGYRFDALFRPLEQLLKPKAAAAAALSHSPAASPAPAAQGLPFGPPGKSPGSQNPVTPQLSH